MSDKTPAERIADMFMSRLDNLLMPDAIDGIKERAQTATNLQTTMPDGLIAHHLMTRAFHVCGFCTPADIKGVNMDKSKERAKATYHEAAALVLQKLAQ